MVQAILKSLTRHAGPIQQIEPPECPGFYALFASRDLHLSFVSITAQSLIYIGASNNLKHRNIDTHFNSKQTGFSTVRRTLGASLKKELSLTARPRGSSPNPDKPHHFRFDPEGEDHLTEWMTEHISGSCHAFEDPKSLEHEVIAEACPVLNLTHWDNPYRQKIKRLRKVCAQEANG